MESRTFDRQVSGGRGRGPTHRARAGKAARLRLQAESWLCLSVDAGLPPGVLASLARLGYSLTPRASRWGSKAARWGNEEYDADGGGGFARLFCTLPITLLNCKYPEDDPSGYVALGRALSAVLDLQALSPLCHPCRWRESDGYIPKDIPLTQDAHQRGRCCLAEPGAPGTRGRKR